MADYESNLIKPVKSLQTIAGLTPARQRDERKRRQQLHHEDNEKDETTQDQEAQPEKKSDVESDINTESIGIDYCA